MITVPLNVPLAFYLKTHLELMAFSPFGMLVMGMRSTTSSSLRLSISLLIAASPMGARKQDSTPHRCQGLLSVVFPPARSSYRSGCPSHERNTGRGVALYREMRFRMHGPTQSPSGPQLGGAEAVSVDLLCSVAGFSRCSGHVRRGRCSRRCSNSRLSRRRDPRFGRRCCSRWTFESFPF